MRFICLQKLNHLEVDIIIPNEEGVKVKKTMVAKYDDAANQTSPETKHCLQKRECLANLVQLLTSMAGEFIGTFFLILMICSAVSSSILSGAQVGLWQVAVVCGLGVALSIYCTAHISDAHLNPAITVAFGIIRYKSFSWKKILPYIFSQMLGGMLAGAMVYAFANNAIALYEEARNIERGENASVITAMMFGEYFPNPALYNHSIPENLGVTTLGGALAIEIWTTGILAFVVFSVTNDSNSTIGQEGNKVMAPLMIGLTVSLMISVYGPYTQVGMNPARDFGPRLIAACAGWGRIAVPGPRNGFWVYILGPLLGGPIGAAMSDLLIIVRKRWKIVQSDSES